MDIVPAGADDDFVWVLNRSAARDAVNCDGGFDRMVADCRDLLSGCHRVSRP